MSEGAFDVFEYEKDFLSDVDCDSKIALSDNATLDADPDTEFNNKNVQS